MGDRAPADLEAAAPSAADAAKAAQSADDTAAEAAQSISRLAANISKGAWLLGGLLLVLSILVLVIAFAVLGIRGPTSAGGVSIRDIVSLLAAAIAAGLVVAGVIWNEGGEQQPRSFIQRELAEQRARREALTALGLVLLGVSLLAATMFSVNGRMPDPAPAAQSPPSSNASAPSASAKP